MFLGSRVQCVALTVDSSGNAGRAVHSSVVTMPFTSQFCPPSYLSSHGAQAYSAKIHYTGTVPLRNPLFIYCISYKRLRRYQLNFRM